MNIFYDDGTGGRDANPYPYGTKMGDADNWQELERQAQIDSDWEDLDKINNRFKSSKNPVLAKDYNHNVEDGREEAEAYADGMTEGHLRKLVRNALNEVLNEVGNTEKGQEKLGALTARKLRNGDYKSSADIDVYADDVRRKEWGKSTKDKDAMDKQKRLRKAYSDGYSHQEKP